MKETYIAHIQRFSLHDGGGIRTVVFLKGCPFICPWCCNPENMSFKQEVIIKKSLCTCCPFRKASSSCNVSIADCPTGAKTLVGKVYSIDDLVEEVLKDKVFFEESGGGVTLSGGEALAHEQYAESFFAALKKRGVNTAIETTLAIPLKNPQRLVEVTDAFLVDFKIADNCTSKKVLRIDTAKRDANLEVILKKGACVVARLPLIPGFTDDEKTVLSNIKRILKLGIGRVDVLPFHQLGEKKYEYLNKVYTMHNVPLLADEVIKKRVSLIESFGLKVVVNGE